MLLTGLGLLLLSQNTVDSAYVTGVLPALVLVGAGYGSVLAPGMARATLGVLPQHAGAASGLVNASQQIGLAIGTATLVAVAVAATGAQSTPSAAVAGYNAAYLTGAIVITVGAALEAVIYRVADHRAPISPAAERHDPGAGTHARRLLDRHRLGRFAGRTPGGYAAYLRDQHRGLWAVTPEAV